MARVFTETVIKIIRELASQGKSAPEIAMIVDSTPGSVRVMCCKFKISLGRRGRPGLVPDLPGDNEGWLVVHMKPEGYAALRRRAVKRGKSAVELARMLLEAVISDNIFEAVLGDDHK